MPEFIPETVTPVPVPPGSDPGPATESQQTRHCDNVDPTKPPPPAKAGNLVYVCVQLTERAGADVELEMETGGTGDQYVATRRNPRFKKGEQVGAGLVVLKTRVDDSRLTITVFGKDEGGHRLPGKTATIEIEK